MTFAIGALVLFLICLLILEYALELRSLRQAALADMGQGPQDAPYYSWAYYTQSGVRFAFWRGFLKLQMSPHLVYRNLANQKHEYFNTNSHGFRGQELAKTKSKKRVVLLGGSTAFGTGMRSDEETLAHHLSTALDVEVANAAVIGHRSGQELVFIATELLHLKPDLIVSLTGWNDFSQFWLSEMKNHPLGFAACELIDEKVAESQRLLGATLPQRLLQLPRLLFPVLERKLKVALRKREAGTNLGPQGAGWKIPKLAESFARNVVMMRDLAHARGVPFVCFLQPVAQRPGGQAEIVLPQWPIFRRLAQDLLAAEGVLVTDLNDGSLSDSLYFDPVHLTAEGHKILSSKVTSYLVDGKFLA